MHALSIWEEDSLNYEKVHVRWSSPIPCQGADASPIPNRGGVYEMLFEEMEGVDRLFIGYSQDLRRAFISHMGGSKGNAALRKELAENVTFFRYWLCEQPSTCKNVVSALADSHYYECGSDAVDDANCIEVMETH